MGRSTKVEWRRVRRGFTTVLACACIAGAATQAGPSSAREPARAEPAQAVPAIDNSDRQDVGKAYRTILRPALNTPGAFTGDLATCTVGHETAASRKATFDAVNFYRRMVGLKPVVDEPAWTQAVMELAVMSAAQGNISHFPTPDWACYTAAADDAAARSNLGIGTAGATAIRDYMADWGNPSGGHRRYILFPPATRMATGSTSFTNALRVLDDMGHPRPSNPDWVAWPPAGWVPRPVLPMEGNGRLFQWSLSSNKHPDADFSDAKVAMKMNDEPLVETLLTLANGYGDNTLLWNAKRSGGKAFPKRGAVFTVTVSNVKVPGGGKTSRHYTVRPFIP